MKKEKIETRKDACILSLGIVNLKIIGQVYRLDEMQVEELPAAHIFLACQICISDRISLIRSPQSSYNWKD